MNKHGSTTLIIVGVILSLITAVISLKILTNAVKNEDVTATKEPVVVITETMEEVTITRVGTSGIKKLELPEGCIYFTDGWATFIPK